MKIITMIEFLDRRSIDLSYTIQFGEKLLKAVYEGGNGVILLKCDNELDSNKLHEYLTLDQLIEFREELSVVISALESKIILD